MRLKGHGNLALWYEDEKVHINVPRLIRISCMYQIRKAEIVFSEKNLPVTEAVFDAAPECGYFRITVVDKTGKRACTNAYFTDEL